MGEEEMCKSYGILNSEAETEIVIRIFPTKPQETY